MRLDMDLPRRPAPLHSDRKAAELMRAALRVRERIIRMSEGGGCFIGASLSCADLLVYLYREVLRVTPDTLKDPDRDYFFLSKGHDAPALYAVLADLGFIDEGRLDNHLRTTDSIYWHPSRLVPGVEFHSGSLGHLLSVAIGVGIDIKLRNGDNMAFVLLGDGELNEGSIWEACLVANAHRLDNLVAIVDRNQFQANMRTEELIPLDPLAQKFEAFGWSVKTLNGHSFPELAMGFSRLPARVGRPTAIIAHTVRGKGLPSLEERAERWFARFTSEEVTMLIEELRGGV